MSTRSAPIAAALGFPGIWFLNGSYQWSCTALAREEDGAPWLARTLDWPFPGLGRYVEIARMQRRGRRVLQRHLAGLCRRADRDGAGPLCAPRSTRRRCARRSTIRGCAAVDHRRQCGADAMSACAHIPPDQLLRQVFETLRDYDEARTVLETHADRAAGDLHAGRLPAGERCVIERTEDRLQHAHRRSRRGQRLARQHAAVGRPHRREQGVHLLLRGGRAMQPRPPRGAGALAAARSRATASAGSRRRCSILTRGSRSRCVRRAASCARSATSCDAGEELRGR